MDIKKQLFPNLASVSGVLLATIEAGIRYAHRKDLVLIALPAQAHIAAVFTQNVFCAAPVQVARQHLQQRQPHYLMINTGNANAGTGKSGLAAALQTCDSLAQQTQCIREQILPFSTGVIGEALPVEPIIQAIPKALTQLTESGWADAARGIMTTDTQPKGYSYQWEYAGRTITLTGIAKGAGMIKPNMATMLSFVATDLAIESTLLNTLLVDAVRQSFNCISIDGDTSTNDACVLIAAGTVDLPELKNMADPLTQSFKGVLNQLMLDLAHAIVRDGEGASKFIEIQVMEGSDEVTCGIVAETIAHSPLVKTALYASDPNWGRILAAVGRAPVSNLMLEGISLWIGEYLILERGEPAPHYQESQVAAYMKNTDIVIRVALGQGQAMAKRWTCDFSEDSVRINADYRS